MSTTRNLVLASVSALLFFPAHAQTIATIDGSEITESQLKAYALGRTGAEANAQNREQLISQIGDLVLLSNVAQRSDLGKDPLVTAELELQRRSVLAQALIQDFVKRNPVSDADALEEYNRQIEEFPAPEQFKASHILLETEDEAKAVIVELDGGADFAELAKEKSTGPSGPQGGDLGWFEAGAMVAPFSQAVSELENGKYSTAPVQTQFGWHVILRQESRKAEAPAFEELKDRLKQGMEQQQFQDYFETLKAEATLEIK
ncbi:MAG: peptidylprolyl isomerase [Pseudomonadota bacterium]